MITAIDGSTPEGSGPVWNAGSKQYTYNINAGRQAQFTMNIDNPRANFILNNPCLMKMYRRNRNNVWNLMMVGDVISTEETGQGDVGGITVVGADPFWRLAHRVIGVGIDSRGRGIGWSDGTIGADNVTVVTTKDLGTIIHDLLATLNAWGGTPYAYTGIQAGVREPSINNSIGPIYATIAADVIQQIVTTLGAPDIEMMPVEPTGAWPWTTIAQLNVWAHLGQANPIVPAVFEYGCGKHNVQSYDRLVNRDGMATNVYSLPQGYPSVSAIGDRIISAGDITAAVAEGIREYIVAADNLVSPALRQELVNETLAVLKNPRQQITFVPVPGITQPDFMVDYHVGDVVAARAYDISTNTYRFNGTARLYGVTLQVDENDLETIALTLIPGG